jgi:alpha-L-fucosidase
VLATLGLRKRTEDKGERSKDFVPYRYKSSTEELKAKFSEDMMKRAAAASVEIEAINAKGRWKPTWESIDRHQAPEWFRDAKLGIMINWGLYSVPSWDQKKPKAMYPDAYGSWMYDLKSHIEYHNRVWGADFQYDDFFPLFTEENYDPEGMVALLHEIGARYIVPFSKHHDGVAWWDSAWTKRNFVQMGPQRDLLTPLMEAARKREMKVCLYFTYEEYANVVLGENGQIYARLWPLANTPTLHPLSEVNRRRVAGNIPVRNYYDQYMLPLVKEMVDRFDPDGLWMDGEWCTPTETLHSRELAAYLYNKAQGRKEVYINDRYGLGTRNHHGDVFGSEFHSTQSLDHAWEECRGISNSFAYNHEDSDESMLSRQQLVDMFIDTISHNGNLNLIIGPDRTGKIPDLQLDRLRALGRWINANAEAVYGTRVLAPYAEGSVCYTRSKDGRFAYAICKQWPGKALTLTGVRAKRGTRIHMLGIVAPLAWKEDGKRLVITIPDILQDEKTRPCEYAWVVRIPLPR